MTTDPVIRVAGLSKAYDLYAKPSDLLKELVLGGIRHDVFWALRDVSFDVQPGDRLGIVGPNGAGKSTLLQIVAGNLQPTAGQVQVNGVVSALLSLVPAWNVNQTGLENIRFNLLLRGSTPAQIALMTDEIVAFAELGRFITQPVRTYSAGMSARLSFAIATAISPEILIVDEVLGAGDGYFAGKAVQRMRDLCDRGKALLFVSHSLAAVQQMCNRVIWMQDGRIRMDGYGQHVLREYELDYRRAEDELTRAGHRAASEAAGSAVTVDDMEGAGRVRFRLIPAGSGRFATTHFVHALRVGRDRGATPDAADLGAGTLAPDGPVQLDLEGSEWGRLHERRGKLTRSLSRAHGRRRGGQFVVEMEATDSASPFTIDVDLETPESVEAVGLEVLDPTTGRWQAVDTQQLRVADGVKTVRFSGEVKFPVEEARAALHHRLIAEAGPAVDIVDAAVTIDGERVTTVREREDFAIAVRLRFHRFVPLADVGVKLTRADGVYVFWQSSGLVGVNLVGQRGERTVRFRFDNHSVGAGEYSVGVTVGNGWDFPDNYPYSEILARSLEACRFRVLPEIPHLDFGVVNQRVPVEVD